MTGPHPHVPHPRDLRPRREVSAFNEWVTRHLATALGSVTGMWLAFVVPLVAFKVPLLLKVLGLVSSYWVQLWALFVLQRTANRAEQARDAKADADHMALTSVHHGVDEVRDRLDTGTPGGLGEVLAAVHEGRAEMAALAGIIRPGAGTPGTEPSPGEGP